MRAPTSCPASAACCSASRPTNGKRPSRSTTRRRPSRQSPILRQLIANRNADTLELTNGITIEVRSASFRRLRGPTYIAVIADEAAFWFSDEFSANADTEILNAVRPGLATTRGPLIIAARAPMRDAACCGRRTASTTARTATR